VALVAVPALHATVGLVSPTAASTVQVPAIVTNLALATPTAIRRVQVPAITTEAALPETPVTSTTVTALFAPSRVM
jgi:hypothetical protein